jgi:PAS domain S-box-containing protein
MEQGVAGSSGASRGVPDRGERVAAALAGHPDAMIVVGGPLTIELANPAAEELFGFAEGGLTGVALSQILPSTAAEVLSGNPPAAEETVIGRRKDGRNFPATAGVVRMEPDRGVVIVVRNRVGQERTAEEFDAAAAERRQIGQDLHDDLGQELIGLDLLVGTLVDVLRQRGSPELAVGLKIRDGMNRVLERIRAVTEDLTASDLSPSELAPALEVLAARTRDLGGIDCRFETSGDVRLPGGPVARQLLRIAQEAVANALKHAAPRVIAITLAEINDRIELHVRDYGRGIDPTATAAGTGLGLKTMRYRAAQIGATLNLEPENPGTSVRCIL